MDLHQQRSRPSEIDMPQGAQLMHAAWALTQLVLQTAPGQLCSGFQYKHTMAEDVLWKARHIELYLALWQILILLRIMNICFYVQMQHGQSAKPLHQIATSPEDTLGREQGKGMPQVEAHLLAKQGEGPCACAVWTHCAVLYHIRHQI